MPTATHGDHDTTGPDLPANVSPLGIEALDHTAIAVRDLQAALSLYRDLLGGQPCEYIELREMGFCTLALRYPNGNCIELMAPIGEHGFLQEFLAKRGEGVHHLTFLVPDLRAAVERARAAGLRVVEEDYRDPAWFEAFISPRSAYGALIQLAQTSLDHAGREHHWPVPAALLTGRQPE